MASWVSGWRRIGAVWSTVFKSLGWGAIVFLGSFNAYGSEEYTLGVGDVVSVDVRNMGEKEYAIEALRIPASGYLSLPLVGTVEFQGRNTSELEQQLRAELEGGYLNRPQVTINVVEYRPFFVRGAVREPGAFEYRFGLTVGKVLAIAGGLTERGDVNAIERVREISVDQASERVGMHTEVYPGDVITVPTMPLSQARAEIAPEYVYLYGEVNKPGGYEYREGMTIEMAVALAGGFTPRASKRKVSVRSHLGDEPTLRKRVKLAEQIQPGDVVTVGQSYF